MSSRPRNRARTTKELRAAFKRQLAAGGKLSITSVAAEVGVEPSLLHHTYPQIAKAIREAKGTTRSRSDLRTAHDEALELIADLRADLALVLCELTEAASLNLALELQLRELRANARTAVIAIRPAR